MVSQFLLAACLLATAAYAQTTTEDPLTLLTSLTSGAVSDLTSPTGSYLSYSTQINVTGTSTFGLTTDVASTMGSGNTTTASTTASQTLLQGTAKPTTASPEGSASSSTSASSTSSAAQPTNTTPCNGWPEFCTRRYSNITMISAHNSPFYVKGNAASNQNYGVTTQLNDGIRFLQGQGHIVNGSVELCHTSCQLLDAGPLETWLSTIKAWVQVHPYDVVTILIENGDQSHDISPYITAITNSGLLKFAFQPPKVPMTLDDWPTLAEMILNGNRVVLFMDYNSNQAAHPYLLDEFSQVWETPFDPTNRDFPCTPQRPTSLSDADAKNRLSLVNHDLNTEVTLLGNSILVPTKNLLNVTNGVDGYGSLGVTAAQCSAMWGRAPNFLNVDFYDVGAGSVFKVAAAMNGVTYNRTCCGSATSGGVRVRGIGWAWGMLVALGVMWMLIN